MAGVDERGRPAEGFRVILLGTGAACPSKYRNVTAIYIDFFERGGLLLDCGEGTLTQFIRCAPASPAAGCRVWVCIAFLHSLCLHPIAKHRCSAPVTEYHHRAPTKPGFVGACGLES